MTIAENVRIHPTLHKQFQKKLADTIDSILEIAKCDSNTELLAIVMGILEIGIMGGSFPVEQVKRVFSDILAAKERSPKESA